MKINKIFLFLMLFVSLLLISNNVFATEGEETIAKADFSEQIKEVTYDDIVLNNKTLRIITAKELTSDSEINSELNINTIVTKLATIGKMPVEYNVEIGLFSANE